jgi:hypothetical protein
MTNVMINSLIQDEISRISETYAVDSSILEEFAAFVINNHKTKPKTIKTAKVKPLSLAQLKEAIYEHFSVSSTAQLKRSNSFKMATDGIDDLNLGRKDAWETLYRELIGILPHEANQQGYGCINGIDIFKYFRPWQVFGLDPQTANQDDIKQSYRKLSKVYHPDAQQTGDTKIFDRLNAMYKSIAADA